MTACDDRDISGILSLGLAVVEIQWCDIGVKEKDENM